MIENRKIGGLTPVFPALTGQEARGGAATNDRPYNDTLTYDAMGHLSGLTRLNWDNGDGFGVHTYVNDRISGWWYDADGRVTSGSTGYFTYDAAGRARSFGDEDPYKTDQEFDGNGNKVKTIARRWDEVTEQFVTEKITYYISSTVLGGKVVTELSEQGAKERTSVFAGGGELASQSITSGNQSVQWQHRDPSGASYRGTDSTGQSNAAKELDPLGANAGLMKPITWNVPDKQGLTVPYPEIADMLTNPGGGCTLDRVPIPCEIKNSLMNAGNLVNETLINRGKGWEVFRDAVRPRGVGVFTTFNYYVRDELRANGFVITVPQNTYDPRVDFRDYAKELSQNNKITDCLKLALMIYKAGQVFGTDSYDNGRGIMRGLMAGLTDWTEVNLGGREGPSDRNYRVGVYRSDPHYAGGFGDSGFARHFQDDSNQVRHFVFYLGAGYGLPQTAARYGLHREEGTNNPQVADVGLGWVGIDLGNHFNGNYRQLAQDVWRRVCGQSSKLNLP